MTATETLGAALAARFDGAHHAATAIELGGRSISYARLSSAARAIADELLRQGVKQGAHVGVLAADGSLVVAALLGILARGCVFALLDPAHPAKHLRELADAAALECVLVEAASSAAVEEAFAGGARKIVEMTARIYEAEDPLRTVAPLLARAAERPLYLYFSSGTTGTPKPILGRADSLLHFVRWEIETLGLDSTVRVAQLTSPSHDPYLRDVFTPLVAGGTICIPERRLLVLSAVELGRWLDEAAVQLIHCTPTVFRNLCNGGLVGRSFARLRHVLIAGEQLRGAHLAAWYEALGDRVQLVNLYGPTETTLAKLFYFVSPAEVGRAVIPIGRPMPGARVTVMASPSQACEDSEVGELYIETAFATLGYYGHPALTREVFEPDPSASSSGPVVYRTGDLVRRLPGGELEFVGRRDRRQKVRGKQIDLGCVEDEVVRLTEIDCCIVSVIFDEAGGEMDRLVVCYAAPQDLDEQAIKQRLSRELPRSMIPDVWIRVDALPTTVNGKMHVDELAALVSRHEAARREPGGAAEPARDEVTDRLTALWQELLRNEAIGLDDPFMEVGGDSLTIMLLIARLDEDYGFELSLWQVFDDLTIRKLSALIAGGTEAPAQDRR